MTICQSFRELGALTWRRLEAAGSSGLFWSEETNTETILMELMQRHPSEVRVEAFAKGKEARNGADWEWWIGSHRGGWLGMRIQAKRLKLLPSEAFAGLQKQKAKKQPLSQIDTLIAEAKKDSLNPLYCFYSNSKKWPSSALWAGTNVGTALPPQGCFVAHAVAVKSTRSDALSRLTPFMFPWHLLVCPAVTSAGTKSIAATAHSIISQVIAGGFPSVVPASAFVGDFPIFPPQEQLPEYMEFLLETESSDGGALDGGHALSRRAAQRNLAGFVLINSREDGAWDQ